MEANIHAFILLGILPSTLAMGYFFRTPNSAVRSWWIELSQRLLYALLTFIIFIVVVMVAVPFYKGGHTPQLQIYLPLLTALLVALIIKRRVVCLWLIVGQIGLAILLGHHYNHLVYNQPACLYTGEVSEFIANSCNKPSIKTPLWHSPFTGIYKIQLL